MNIHLALYATIKNYELSERIRREDLTFDAFDFLSIKIGHKSSSTLRKMCEPRSNNNGAKLGFEEACTIIEITGDSRLLDWAQDHVIRALAERKRQIELFVETQHLASHSTQNLASHSSQHLASQSISTNPPKINSKASKRGFGIPEHQGNDE